MATDTDYAASLGENIRTARLRAGLGLRELARQAELSVTTLFEIEAGSRVPAIDKVHKIAVTLGVQLAKLLPTK